MLAPVVDREEYATTTLFYSYFNSGTLPALIVAVHIEHHSWGNCEWAAYIGGLDQSGKELLTERHVRAIAEGGVKLRAEEAAPFFHYLDPTNYRR